MKQVSKRIKESVDNQVKSQVWEQIKQNRKL